MGHAGRRRRDVPEHTRIGDVRARKEEVLGAVLRSALRERVVLVHCPVNPTMVGIVLMAQSAAKLSVSVPLALAAAVRRRVGARGLSGFVARAMAHELEREQLGSFLAELDSIHGPVPTASLGRARRAWPKR